MTAVADFLLVLAVGALFMGSLLAGEIARLVLLHLQRDDDA